jgi:hypothetical protein
MMHDSIGPCLDRMQLEQVASGQNVDEKQTIHMASCQSCQEQLESIRDENDFLGEFLGANAEVIQAGQGDQHQVDGYQIICEIHRGGQGIVYEAEQISTPTHSGHQDAAPGTFRHLEAAPAFRAGG